MSKSRKAAVVPQENMSIEEVETLLGEYAAVDAQLETTTSKMDEKITKVRQEFDDKLAPLVEKKEALFAKIQGYGLLNKGLFGEKRSKELTHGVIGFRIHPHKLVTLKGFTWAAVTNLLKDCLPAYVRTKEEPAKDELIAHRDDEEVAKLFPKCGIQVVQEEQFFIELKKEVAPKIAA